MTTPKTGIITKIGWLSQIVTVDGAIVCCIETVNLKETKTPT